MRFSHDAFRRHDITEQFGVKQHSLTALGICTLYCVYKECNNI